MFHSLELYFTTALKSSQKVKLDKNLVYALLAKLLVRGQQITRVVERIVIFTRNGHKKNCLNSPRRYLQKRKTTEWIESRLSHAVTKQALGENFKYRKFPLEKETAGSYG